MARTSRERIHGCLGADGTLHESRAAAAAAAPAPAGLAQDSMAQILVIDDSPTIVHQLTLAMRADGHTVSSPAAFSMLRQHLQETPTDLVILDLGLPGVSGVALGRQLRQYLGPRRPILIYSSRPEAEMQRAAVQLGARHVPKGADVEPLRRAVRELLAEQADAKLGR